MEYIEGTRVAYPRRHKKRFVSKDRKLTQSLRNAPRREEDTTKAQGTARGVPKAV